MASSSDPDPDQQSQPPVSSPDRPDPSAAPSPATPAAAPPGDGALEKVAVLKEEGAISSSDAAGEGEEDEEEEAECGFCLFMKGGGCKDSFVAWEKCVEDAERFGEDVVEKCFEVTSLLKKCMDAHADYYAPILQAEQAMADAVGNDSAAADDGASIDNAISQSATKADEKKDS